MKKYKTLDNKVLTEIKLEPNKKTYYNVTKGQTIIDSFIINNLGSYAFVPDFINTSLNNLKLLSRVDTIKPNTLKLIKYQYQIDNNYIDKKKILTFSIIVAGNCNLNIRTVKVSGFLK